MFRGLLQASADVLAMVKNQFFLSHGEEKEEYRRTIVSQESQLRKKLSAEYGEEVVDWRIQFAEAFVNKRGGFDVVLANPPYVRQELIKDIKPKLKVAFPEMYSGTADLYCYFYTRALQLLRTAGMLVFISSNKWFRAKYGSKLRAYVADTCTVNSITDFGELPVFEDAATFPMIFVARKKHAEAKTIFTQVKSLEPPYPDVLALVRLHGQVLPRDALTGTDWQLADARSVERLQLMQKRSIKLKDYISGQAYYGIKTGLNEAFFIDSQTREALIADDPRSDDLIKPLAVGDDVRRCVINARGRWLIVTRIGVEIKRYPAILEHLSKWKVKLAQRQDIGNHWYELRTCAYYAAFESPKIVFPVICKEPRFTLDEAGFYTNDKTFIIPTDDLFLLGVLNSKPFWNYAKAVSSVLGDENRGGRLMLQWAKMKDFPIPIASEKGRRPVVELVQKCLHAKGVNCTAHEQEIDDRVASLYGLDVPGL